MLDPRGLAASSGRILFDVEKDDGTWLTLTLADSAGSYASRLIRTSGIEMRQERGLGYWDIPDVTLTVDNTDRFWNGPPPAGISSWLRRRVRIREMRYGAIETLIHLLIDKSPKTSRNSNSATISCVARTKLLAEQTAERVKDGRSWHTNKPIAFLVREVLRQVFTSSEIDTWRAAGTLLDTYEIPVADGTRQLSSMERAPGYDGTEWKTGTLEGHPLVAVNDASAPNGLDGKLVFAVGGELWVRDPVLKKSTRLRSLTDAGLSANYRIMQLRYCMNNHRIIGIAWEPDIRSDTSSTYRHRSGAATTGPVRFFRSDGSTSSTGLEVFAAPTNLSTRAIYTGIFSVRAGGYHAGSNLTGLGGDCAIQQDTVSFGIDVPLPHPQWHAVRVPGATTVGNQIRFSTTSYNANTGVGIDASKYQENSRHAYMTMRWLSTGDNRPMDYSFNIGQHRGAFAMQNNGKYLLFTTIDWNNATKLYTYAFYRLDCSSSVSAPTYEFHSGGAWTTSGTPTDITFGGFTVQPVALAFQQSDSTFGLACVHWSESGWSGGAPLADSVKGYILEYPFSSPSAVAAVFDSTDSIWNGTWYEGTVPLSIQYAPNSNLHIATTWFGTYTSDYSTALYYSAGATAAAKIATEARSHDAAVGMCLDTTAGRFYWIETGSNMLWSMPQDNNTVAPTVDGGGLHPVDADGSLQAGLVYCAAQNAIIGISAAGVSTQCNREVMGSELVSANLWWQFKNKLAGYIDVGDFGDKSCLDVLRECTQLGDFQLYADPPTDYIVFLARAGATVPDLTIKATGPPLDSLLLVEDIAVDRGFDEVVNYCEMTPARAVLGQLAVTARILARPAAWDRPQWNGSLVPSANVNRAVSVTMRCVEGGSLGAEDDGCVQRRKDGKAVVDVVSNTATEAAHKLRLAWLEYSVTVEAALTTSTTTSGSEAAKLRVSASQVTDVTAGPVGIGDVVSIDTGVQRTITTIDRTTTPGTAILGLDSAISGTVVYPLGWHVTIRAANNNRWSDEAGGVATLTTALPASNPTLSGALSDSATSFTLSSGTGVRPNTILQIDSEQIRVISSSGTSVTNCERDYNKVGAAAHSNGATVSILTITLSTTARIGLHTVLRMQGSTPGYEDLRVMGLLTDGTTAFVTFGVGGTARMAHAAGVAARAYWAPIINTTYPGSTVFPIGATGLAARLDVQDATSSAQEGPLMVGDQVDLISPGLTLQHDDAAAVVEQNQSSIDRYKGRKQWDGAVCSFANASQCVQIARRIVTDFAFAHFLPSVTGKYVIVPVVGAAYYLQDEYELPWLAGSYNPNGGSYSAPALGDAARAIGTRTRGFRYDPHGDTLKLDLRAMNAHAW